MTKRELKIRALLTVGNADVMICDYDYSDIPEKQQEQFYQEIVKICRSLTRKADRMLSSKNE